MFFSKYFSQNEENSKARRPVLLLYFIHKLGLVYCRKLHRAKNKCRVTFHTRREACFPAYRNVGGWLYPDFSVYMLGSLYPEQSRNSPAASSLCRVFRISLVQVACLPRCCRCRWVRVFDKQNRGASEGEVWQTHARVTAGMRHRERGRNSLWGERVFLVSDLPVCLCTIYARFIPYCKRLA